MKRLEENGEITVLGAGTRRLYATPRRIPEVLQKLPARAIRLLQYMPLEGSVSYSALMEVSQRAATCLIETAEAGLTLRSWKHPMTARLTTNGRRIVKILGDGLRLDETRQEKIKENRKPKAGKSQDVIQAIAQRHPIQEMKDAHERARIRRALCAHLSEAIDKENSGKLSRKAIQRKVIEWNMEKGHPCRKHWVHALWRLNRLPDKIELEALSSVLNAPKGIFDIYVDIAPWVIMQKNRTPLRHRKSPWKVSPTRMTSEE